MKEGEFQLSEDPRSILLLLLVVVLLVFLNAFFVAAEFALVKIRATRIEQLMQEGNKRAKYVHKILQNLDAHLAAAQLGITLVSLALGWIGEPAVASLLKIVLHDVIASENAIHIISFVIGFSLITYFHLTVGEQVPKIFSIEKAESVSLWIAFPLIWFSRITYPFIRIIKGSTDGILKMMGMKMTSSHDETHSEEEIKLIVSNSLDLDPDEQKMLNKVFEFNDRYVREVMVHRKDMDCIYLNDPIEESLTIIEESKHSRFPICGEDRDDVMGYISLKDLYLQKNEKIDLSLIIRQIPRIYETTPIKKALKQMQEEKHQIAIVVDEYGGVSGLVTMEDMIEVIVGNIQDEFDEEEASFSESEHGTIVEASVLVHEVNEELNMSLEEIDGVDTIGGYILSIIEGKPEIDMCVSLQQYDVKIIKADGHRILSLLFEPKETV